MSYLDRKDLGFRDLTLLGRACMSAVSGFAEPAPGFGLYNKQGYHEFAQETIAIDEDDPVQYPSIITAWLLWLFGKYRAEIMSSARPSAETGRSYSVFSQSLNQIMRLKSMGPDPTTAHLATVSRLLFEKRHDGLRR